MIEHSFALTGNSDSLVVRIPSLDVVMRYVVQQLNNHIFQLIKQCRGLISGNFPPGAVNITVGSLNPAGIFTLFDGVCILYSTS